MSTAALDLGIVWPALAAGLLVTDNIASVFARTILSVRAGWFARWVRMDTQKYAAYFEN